MINGGDYSLQNVFIDYYVLHLPSGNKLSSIKQNNYTSTAEDRDEGVSPQKKNLTGSG